MLIHILDKVTWFPPFAFALLPALGIYGTNPYAVQFEAIIPTLAALIVATVILLFGMSRLLKSRSKAMFGVSVFWLWLFSYEAARETLISWPTVAPIARHRYLIPLALVVFVGCFAYVFKSRRTFRVVNLCLAAGAVVASFAQGLALSRTQTAAASAAVSDATAVFGALPTLNADGIAARPDIFYIILDAYTGAAELETDLGFDDSYMTGFLEGRGFYVAPRSQANYSWTLLSMTATLNMDYLPAERNGDSWMVRNVGFSQMILESRFRRTLKPLGYRFVDLTQDTFRVEKSALRMNAFNAALLRSTLLSRPVGEDLLYGFDKHRVIKEAFQTLKRGAFGPGPVFVYAHFLVPHHPYVFDKNGAMPPMTDTLLLTSQERDLYLNQLKYANGQVKEVIDALLSRPGDRPIIIVQGDHGSPPITGRDDVNMRLRMGILNAYLVPADVSSRLYPSISPVNTMRLILNHFGAQLPVLQDRHYFSKMETWLDIKEVSTLGR